MDAAYKGTLGIDNPTLNDEFSLNISTKIPNLVSTLLDAGAPPALAALPHADRVVRYDAFTFMSDLYADPGGAFPNIRDTNGFPSFCDGDAEEPAAVLAVNGTVVDGVRITKNWDYCVTLKHQDEWYWMQYVDPMSHVHQLVAQDMQETVKKFPFPPL
ncbi:hypothetical protein HO173_009882 [Letharia columbiana]|uniref:Uncharacterized protein n=1 Tax=Letharia columbiana TaxID=112416 RepID=A0A8H6FNZ8_9LECA|nr:uncharacterized protein HO173_009882 [Letharia columbiana]KAF6232045.1 hypothetical protein HO173_009882 [Letharia columbiana]